MKAYALNFEVMLFWASYRFTIHILINLIVASSSSENGFSVGFGWYLDAQQTYYWLTSQKEMHIQNILTELSDSFSISLNNYQAYLALLHT